MELIGQIFRLAVTPLERLPAARAILGFILVFFVPGFAWTLVFFRRISVIERIALAFGLSIAIVTLSILSLNVALGVRITGSNSVVTIIAVTVIALAFYYLRRLRER